MRKMNRMLGVLGLGLWVSFPLFAEDAADDAFFDEFLEDESTEVIAVSDPLSGYNKLMFGFNDRLYRWVCAPVASGYAQVVPEVGRISVKNFFDNLSWPKRTVNHCLQGKFSDAGVDTKRFLINSTMGVLGLGDPALNRYELEAVAEDFGQTLASYGVKGGVPITLPLLGPSNLRDALGKIPDYFLEPLTYVDPLGLRLGLRVYDMENDVSLKIGDYQRLKDAALDPYSFFRDVYEQNRNGLIQE